MTEVTKLAVERTVWSASQRPHWQSTLLQTKGLEGIVVITEGKSVGRDTSITLLTNGGRCVHCKSPRKEFFLANLEGDTYVKETEGRD